MAKNASKVKDKRLYKALRSEGIKKNKAKRITQAVGTSSRPSTRRKTPSTSYETWSKAQLLQRAKSVGIKGRTTMTKSQLTRALRAA
jgi:hypothetical protein